MSCTDHSGHARVPILGCSTFCRMLCSRTGGSAYSAPLQMACSATISLYAFEGCIRRAQMGLSGPEPLPGFKNSHPHQKDCQRGASIRQAFKTSTFRNQLSSQVKRSLHNASKIAIDLSHTRVRTVQVQVFSHCQALAQITLPKHLTEIGAEAFEACVSLCTIALPPFLCGVQQSDMSHTTQRQSRPARHPSCS